MKCCKMLFCVIMGAALGIGGCNQTELSVENAGPDHTEIEKVNRENRELMESYKKAADEYGEIAEIPVTEKERCYGKEYHMELVLDTRKNVLSGNVRTIIVNDTGDNLNRICVRNYAAAILEGLGEGQAVISDASISGSGKNVMINVSDTDPSIVYISAEDDLITAKSELELSYSFSVDIPNQKNRFGYAEYENMKMYQLSCCFPVISVYEDGKWNESPYINGKAESNYNVIADYDVSLETPEGYTVVATGEEKECDTTTMIEGKKIREFAMVISDGIEMSTDSIVGVNVNNYGLGGEKNEKYNQLALSAAKDCIELYTKLIGEYPYQELDVVHTFMESAMEYPGMVMIGLPDVKDYHELDESAGSALCSRVAHEVAHQWFYAAVGNDPYKEPWLDEGFAEYCEDYVYPLSGMDSVIMAAKNMNADSTLGKVSYQEFSDWNQVVLEQSGRKKSINQQLDTYDLETDEYSECVYNGGSQFLYELQRTMGEGAFYHMLRTYYETYQFKEATTEDFIHIVRSIDASKEVEELMGKYLD